MMRRPPLFQKILIAMFLLGLFLPPAFIEKDSRFGTEKRTPAPFPHWDGSFAGLAAFPKAFEAWFDDHFGFRRPLVQAYHLMNMLLGTTGNSRVLLGQDGWLFYTDPNDGNSLEDYRRTDPLTPEELERWRLVLETKWAWLKSKGIPYFFIIAPDKHTIYPEHCPSRIKVVGRHSRLDQFMEKIKGTEVPVIDLRGPLLEAKRLGLLYDKTDSHWNPLGAAVAYGVIMRHVAENVPGLIPKAYRPEDFFWVSKPGGDLALMLSLANVLREPAYPLPRPGLLRCTGDVLDAAEDTQDAHTVITDCPAQGKTVLVFRDSFFTRLRRYVSESFTRSVYTFSMPDFPVMEQLIRAHRPDVVLEERVERYLKLVPSPPDPSGEPYQAWLETLFAKGSPIYELPQGDPEALRPIHQVMITPSEQGYALLSEGADPHLETRTLRVDPSKKTVVRVVLLSPEETRWQIFFRTAAHLAYEEENSVSGPLHPGENRFYALVAPRDTAGDSQEMHFRLDPGTVPGLYVLKSFEVRRVP